MPPGFGVATGSGTPPRLALVPARTTSSALVATFVVTFTATRQAPLGETTVMYEP